MDPLLSITPLPGRGLHLDLADCWKRTAPSADGTFWSPECQQLLGEYLGAFLPSAAFDGRQGVVFRMEESGREITSQARPLMPGDALPAIALCHLRRGAAALQAAAEDPRRSQSERLLLRAFRLPDPDVDGAFYWVHGPPDDLRVLILWGVEGEPDTSIHPDEVPAKLPSLPPPPAAPRSRKRALLALGVLLFVGAAIFGRRALDQWETTQQSRMARGFPPSDHAALPSVAQPQAIPELRAPPADSVPPSPAPPVTAAPSQPEPGTAPPASVRLSEAVVPVSANPPGSPFKPESAPPSALPGHHPKSGVPPAAPANPANPRSPNPVVEAHKRLLDKLTPK
ncbi:MAG: hypothetical protein KA004_15850 [Verrucomicrobiales bacterium]|nr:hypothetical protein [Verrucomicrobiales bacterium]